MMPFYYMYTVYEMEKVISDVMLHLSKIKSFVMVIRMFLYWTCVI